MKNSIIKIGLSAFIVMIYAGSLSQQSISLIGKPVNENFTG